MAGAILGVHGIEDFLVGDLDEAGRFLDLVELFCGALGGGSPTCAPRQK